MPVNGGIDGNSQKMAWEAKNPTLEEKKIVSSAKNFNREPGAVNDVKESFSTAAIFERPVAVIGSGKQLTPQCAFPSVFGNQ